MPVGVGLFAMTSKNPLSMNLMCFILKSQNFSESDIYVFMRNITTINLFNPQLFFLFYLSVVPVLLYLW